MENSTPEFGSYSAYEPILEPEEFNQQRLEDARDELDEVRNAKIKTASSFRFALMLLVVSVLIFISTFFIQRLGNNKEPIWLLLLFGIGAAARFAVRRRDVFRSSVLGEEIASSKLSRLEQQIGISNQVCLSIRKVLLTVWDPIGVKDEFYAQNEYDRYVGDLFQLLVSGASDGKLAEYLQWVAQKRMGFSSTPEIIQAHTIEALRLIPLS